MSPSPEPARHATRLELEAGLAAIRSAPREQGTLELIVSRPGVNEREILAAGMLDLAAGLVGDSWLSRCGGEASAADRDVQLTLMSSRAIGLIAGPQERWPLAGDQLFVDLDLSAENLPPGTQVAIGAAVIEVTAEPHTGCGKFVQRFGPEALKFVNSPLGRALNLRGINARVVQAGGVRVGDAVRVVARS